MKPHQQLEVFLPKLRKGIAEVIIASYEFDIRTRAQPRPLRHPENIKTPGLLHVTMELLTNDQDGSEAADWHNALTHAIFDYGDAYVARHGCRPLNPGGPDWTEGPTGRA
jgi:hypothetical protein